MTEKQKDGTDVPAKERDFFLEMAKDPLARVIFANTNVQIFLSRSSKKIPECLLHQISQSMGIVSF